MNSTSTAATSIHAVLAASSFGGSAARAASGTQASRRTAAIFFMTTLRWALARNLLRNDVLGVEPEPPLRPVREPALERCADGPEGDLGPGDAGFLDQGDLQRFLAGLEIEVEEARAVEEVDLVGARHRDHAERRAELDAGAGLLCGLAHRSLGG